MGVPIIDSNGSLTLTGTDQELFTPSSKTGLKHYETHINFKNLVANDKVIVTINIEDEQLSAEEKERTLTIVGVQADPMVVINWLVTSSYSVQARQTNGTFKAITWALYTA